MSETATTRRPQSGDFRDGDYAMVADAVIDAFNPSDDDVAEEAIVVACVEAARDFIAAQPCACTAEMIEDWDQCRRCGVLGRRGDQVVDR